MLRVLVADDNRDSAETLAILLELRGCEVITVFDGEAAVTAFARQRPDVVLLDLGMPKLSGHDACRAIRGSPGGDRAMIVALTGWGQARDREQSRLAGFDLHLVKPVDHATLSAFLAARSSAWDVAAGIPQGLGTASPPSVAP